MARLLGLTQETWSKYETGRLVPPVDVQARIAAIFGVSIREVFPPTEAAAS